MKTYKDFQTEVLGFSARKAKARAMKLLSKKASTKKKKERNMMKALSQDDAKKKAEKAARKTMMQKIAGKGKDLADLSVSQKEKLEKRADQAAKKMGGKYKALAKKFAKVIKKAHTKRAAELKAKKSAEVT